MTNPFRDIDQDTAIRDLQDRVNEALDGEDLAIPFIVRMDEESTFRRIQSRLNEDFHWAFGTLESKIKDVDTALSQGGSGGGPLTFDSIEVTADNDMHTMDEAA